MGAPWPATPSSTARPSTAARPSATSKRTSMVWFRLQLWRVRAASPSAACTSPSSTAKGPTAAVRLPQLLP